MGFCSSASASDVKLYRIAEKADGKVVVGEWIVYKDKRTLEDKGFWSYHDIDRIAPGVGTNHSGKTEYFREELLSQKELEEVFVVKTAPVETAPKIEYPWRDCPQSREYWKQLKGTPGMTEEVAHSLMTARFPKPGRDVFTW